MLSQADLLHLAEAFAARIPRTPDYALDWNTAWRAIASARLRVDDIASAQRALDNVDELCLQAQLRVEVGLWAGQHPASAILELLKRASIYLRKVPPRERAAGSGLEVALELAGRFGRAEFHRH